MKGRLKVLHQRKHDLVAEGDAVLDLATSEEREMTEDETARFEAIDSDLKGIDKAIEREQQQLERKAALIGLGESAPAENVDPGRVVVGHNNEADRPFASFGEQLQAIVSASMNGGGGRDPRLIWTAASGANEAAPSEGGFLVQQDFNTTLLNLMHDQGDILRRVREIPMSTAANGTKLPYVDETSRANGSRWGGVQAFWKNEADTATATKPKFGLIEMDLKKLIGIAYATDEVLSDAAQLESTLTNGFAEELVFKFEDSVVNGTGSGQPLGFLNGGALVSVAAESGQSAATVVTQNVLNMVARLPIRSRRNAVWLVNQDVFPQLYGMTLGSGTAVVLLYRPAGGPGDTSMFGTLAGIPILPVEYAATLGTVGDICLVDLSQYLKIEKTMRGMESSMHVRFINDEQTFRCIWRIDGQPAWKVALTPKNGSATQSPFIALATRA